MLFGFPNNWCSVTMVIFAPGVLAREFPAQASVLECHENSKKGLKCPNKINLVWLYCICLVLNKLADDTQIDVQLDGCQYHK